MSFRLLLAVLAALAMTLAPVGISGGAMAMAPAMEHQGQAMDGGHCGNEQAPGEGGMSDEQACCTAMCSAIAVTPAGAAEPRSPASSRDRPSLAGFGQGFLAELPTPPPRLA